MKQSFKLHILKSDRLLHIRLSHAKQQGKWCKTVQFFLTQQQCLLYSKSLFLIKQKNAVL
jgi:hypothetical protein